ALGEQSVFVTETTGDLRVGLVVSWTANATLIDRNGSIVGAAIGLIADVAANNVVLRASGGIGAAASALRGEPAVTGPGVLTALAGTNIYLAEATCAGANSNTLRVFQAQATTGDVRLTVPDLNGAGQDLLLVDAGHFLSPGTETTVASSGHAEITAGG